MFKSIILGFLILCSFQSFAEITQIPPGGAKIPKEACSKGCVIFEQEDLDNLVAVVEQLKQQAFMQGVHKALEAVKTNKEVQKEFCPRNI